MTNHNKAAVHGLVSQPITASHCLLVSHIEWHHSRRLVPTLAI